MNTEQLLEGINPTYVELNDADVTFVDDDSRDIYIASDLIQADLQVGDIVSIHYKEDDAEVNHEYAVEDIQEDRLLLQWKKQHNSETLNEANPLKTVANKIKNAVNPDYTTRLQRAAKSLEKKDAKERKSAEKLLQRDMSGEGKHWSFYIQKPDGSYTKAQSQDDVKELYYKGISPAIANAIVTTPSNYFVRRGLEDLSRSGIKFTKETADITNGYSMPWPASSIKKPRKRKASTVKPEDDKPADDSSTETPVAPVETPVEQPVNNPTPQPVNHTATDNNVTDINDNSVAPVESPKPADSADSTTKPADPYKAQNNGVTKAAIAKFKKIAFATGLELYDAASKRPVDTTSAKDVARITPETLPDYQVKIRGKIYELRDWLRHAMKNGVINESLLRQMLLEAPVVKLDDDDLMDPSHISFKDKIRLAQRREEEEKQATEKQRRVEELKAAAEPTIEKFNDMKKQNSEDSDIFDMLFDAFVPASGPADTTGGETLRALARLLYRDSNDGDKFFTGYGLETCGSSASWLFDNGFAEEIQAMIDAAPELAEDDEEYTSALTLLVNKAIEMLSREPELFWTINEEDSREYDYEYIEENQPKYEFELYGSDDIVALVENGILDSWDLNHYVEHVLEFESSYRDSEVARPWSHHDTSVTVTDLTRDGYERLKDEFEHNVDGWWEELVSEHADELANLDQYDDDYEG